MNDPEIDLDRLSPTKDTKDPTHRDDTRRWVALGLLGLIFFITALIGEGVIFGCITIDGAKDLALILLAPTVSVFGIVVGFFFGQDRD